MIQRTHGGGVVSEWVGAVMSALLVVVAGAVCLYVTLYYGVLRGARCCGAVRLRGKTAVVTAWSSYTFCKLNDNMLF